MWTTAEDMAHYLQFHISKGALGKTRLLNEDLAETMYTPPNTPAQYAYSDSSYALGITVNTRHGSRRFQHGGGGFGFNSSMIWYPELKLGMVVLANTALSDDYVVRLNQTVLDEIINKQPTLYTQRVESATRVEPAYPPDKNENILSDSALLKLIKNKALPDDTVPEKQRNALAGTYVIIGLGDTAEINDYESLLTYSFLGDTEEPLFEVEPGLFFTPYGDTVDFRGRIPTFSNIRLAKVDAKTRLFQIVFYALCGLVFLSTLFYWPVRALFRRTRRKSESENADIISSSRNLWLIWMGIFAVLASLFSLLILIIILLIPNGMYILANIPLMRPYMDLLWWQIVLLSLPYASLLFALVMALMAILSLRDQEAKRAIHFYYLIVAIALLAFNLATIL